VGDQQACQLLQKRLGGVDSLFVPLRALDQLLAVVEDLAQNTTLAEAFRDALRCVFWVDDVTCRLAEEAVRPAEAILDPVY